MGFAFLRSCHVISLLIVRVQWCLDLTDFYITKPSVTNDFLRPGNSKNMEIKPILRNLFIPDLFSIGLVTKGRALGTRLLRCIDVPLYRGSFPCIYCYLVKENRL